MVTPMSRSAHLVSITLSHFSTRTVIQINFREIRREGKVNEMNRALGHICAHIG